MFKIPPLSPDLRAVMTLNVVSLWDELSYWLHNGQKAHKKMHYFCVTPVITDAFPQIWFFHCYFWTKVSLHITECVVLSGEKKGPLTALSERCATARANGASGGLQVWHGDFSNARLEHKTQVMALHQQ